MRIWGGHNSAHNKVKGNNIIKVPGTTLFLCLALCCCVFLEHQLWISFMLPFEFWWRIIYLKVSNIVCVQYSQIHVSSSILVAVCQPTVSSCLVGSSMSQNLLVQNQTPSHLFCVFVISKHSTPSYPSSGAHVSLSFH